MKRQKTLTTPIVFALIFFFPLGLFLIYKRLTCNQIDIMNNAKITKNFGIGFIIFGAMCFITSPQAKYENGESAIFLAVVFGFLFLALGGFMLRLSDKMQKRAMRYQKYIAIILHQQVYSLDKIARLMAIDYSAAVEDITKMMELGFFGGTYIDNIARKIVLPAVHTEKSNLIPIHCEACGANNLIPQNTVGTCEYCGSVLRA